MSTFNDETYANCNDILLRLPAEIVDLVLT